MNDLRLFAICTLLGLLGCVAAVLLERRGA